MNTPIKRIISDLLPSFIALYWYAVVAFIIVLAHCVRLTQQSGFLLPNLLGAEAEGWAATFTQAFVNPLDALLSGASLFPIIITAILWGGAGLVFYKGANAILGFFSAAISTEHEVAISASGGLVHHPSRRFFILHIAWRVCIGIIFLVSLALLPKVVGPLLAEDILLTQAATIWELLRHLGTAILGWMAIFHWFILMTRLFRFFYIY